VLILLASAGNGRLVLAVSGEALELDEFTMAETSSPVCSIFHLNEYIDEVLI
jgi:hypothetical protein